MSCMSVVLKVLSYWLLILGRYSKHNCNSLLRHWNQDFIKMSGNTKALPQNNLMCKGTLTWCTKCWGKASWSKVHQWSPVEKEYEKIGEKTQPDEVVEPQMDILSSSQASPKTFVWELHSLHKDSLSLVIFLLKMPLVLMGAPILSCMCLMPSNSLHRCC